MTDNLPGWDLDWLRRPSAADRADAAELWNSYASGSRVFPLVLSDITIHRYETETLSWPPLIIALLEQATQTALGSQGELGLARLRADLCDALDDAETETP